MITFTDEKYEEALKKAPGIIQERLARASALGFIDNFRTKYGVHVDALDSIDELTRYKLVGLIDEEAFKKEILSLCPNVEKADGVISSINTLVFIPLNQQLRDETTAPKDNVVGSSLVSSLAKNTARSTATVPVPTAPTSTFIPRPSKAPAPPTPRSTVPVPAPTKSAPVVPLAVAVPPPPTHEVTPRGLAPAKSLVPEIAPPHELTVRTMKQDAVATKAGEKASKYILPKKEASAQSEPTKVSKFSFGTPKAPAAPVAPAPAKPTFSKYFAAPPAPKPPVTIKAEPRATVPLPPPPPPPVMPATPREAAMSDLDRFDLEQKMKKVSGVSAPTAPKVSAPVAPTPASTPAPTQPAPQTTSVRTMASGQKFLNIKPPSKVPPLTPAVPPIASTIEIKTVAPVTPPPVFQAVVVPPPIAPAPIAAAPVVPTMPLVPKPPAPATPSAPPAPSKQTNPAYPLDPYREIPE